MKYKLCPAADQEAPPDGIPNAFLTLNPIHLTLHGAATGSGSAGSGAFVVHVDRLVDRNVQQADLVPQAAAGDAQDLGRSRLIAVAVPQDAGQENTFQEGQGPAYRSSVPARNCWSTKSSRPAAAGSWSRWPGPGAWPGADLQGQEVRQEHRPGRLQHGLLSTLCSSRTLPGQV